MRRLLRLIQSHIRYKIIMPYLALTVLVTLAGAAIVLILVAANAQDVLTNNLAAAARATSDALVRREQGHIDYLRQIALSGASVENGTPAVAAAIASGNTEVVSKTLSVFYLVGVSNVNLDLDRMIAFDRGGKALVDWQRIERDPTKPPFFSSGTDLTPIPDVQRIIDGQVVDGADKFSGLVQFANDPQPYFYTIVPVRQPVAAGSGPISISARSRASSSRATARRKAAGPAAVIDPVMPATLRPGTDSARPPRRDAPTPTTAGRRPAGAAIAWPAPSARRMVLPAREHRRSWGRPDLRAGRACRPAGAVASAGNPRPQR